MPRDKFQFIALCAVDIVGAIIDRPAVQCYEFAENQCEYENSSARALGERPYIHNRKSSINCNLYGWEGRWRFVDRWCFFGYNSTGR